METPEAIGPYYIDDDIWAPGHLFYEALNSWSEENRLIVSFTNHGYIDIALNMVQSLKNMGITNYVLFALDEKTFEELQRQNIQTLFLGVKDAIFQQTSHNFGTVEFNDICNLKPKVVLKCIKAGWNVVWTDTDIVWLKNPLPYFDLFKEEDLLVQRDDDDICAGFFHIRATSKSIRLLEEVISFVNPCVDDQTSLRRSLRDESMCIQTAPKENPNHMEHETYGDIAQRRRIDGDINKLQYLALNRAEFPNGNAYFHAKLPQRLGIEPYIVHNNCIIGHNSKRTRFEDYGLWFTSYQSFPYKVSLKNHPIWRQIEPIYVMKGHIDIVTSLQYVHSEQKIYSFSLDKTIRSFDLVSKDLTVKYLNTKGGAWSALFLENKGPYHLVTGGHDKKVMCYQKDLSPVQSFTGHYGMINDVKFDSGVLFSASDDHTIRAWDVETFKSIQVYRGALGPITSLAIYKGAVLGASHDGTIRAWNIKTGSIVCIYQGHEGWVRSILIHMDKLYSAGSDDTIRRWNLKSGQCEVVMEAAHKGGVNALKVFENFIYSVGDDGVLSQWDVDKNAFQFRKRIQAHNSIIYCLDVINDNTVVTGGYDRLVKVWSFKT